MDGDRLPFSASAGLAATRGSATVPVVLAALPSKLLLASTAHFLDRSTSWFRCPFCMAFLTLVFTASLLSGCSRLNHGGTSDSVSSEAAALATLIFGKAWVTDSLPVALAVTNTSDVPIEVVDIRTSCACTEVDPDKFLLEGKAHRRITLRIDLTRSANQVNTLSVPFETVLRPLMKDDSSTEWSVTGRVRLPFARPGGFINLGEIDGRTRKGEFELRRHPLVSEIEVAAADPDLTVRSVKRGESGEADRYEVRLAEKVPLGPFRSSLQFTPTPLDGTALRPIEVVASGLLAGDLSWSPRRLILTSELRDAGGELISIRSRSGSPVVVETVSSPSEFVAADLVPSDDESSAAVRVRLRDDATAGINLSTEVLILIKCAADPEEQVIEVPVIAFLRTRKQVRATANQ